MIEALGGHGEFVQHPDDLTPAIERALASGLPACINVAIDSVAAPTFRSSG
jgi:acetolactate synthase-1/2/3 large subunit